VTRKVGEGTPRRGEGAYSFPMRLTVSPLMLAVSLGLLHASALDAELPEDGVPDPFALAEPCGAAAVALLATDTAGPASRDAAEG
jgi:hypothetical protein